MDKRFYLSPECPGQLDDDTDYDALRGGKKDSVGISLQGWSGDPLLSVNPIYFCTTELANQLHRRFGVESHSLRIGTDPEYDFFLEEYYRTKPTFRRLELSSFSARSHVGLLGPYLLVSEDALSFLLQFTVWADLEFAEVPLDRDWDPEELALKRPSPQKRFPTQ